MEPFLNNYCLFVCLLVCLFSRGKGSCKNYTDTSHPSDKGKGRGSPAVANGAIRSQSSSKKSTGGSSQPPKKQTKVSFLYSRYKNSPATAAASVSATSDFCNPPIDEDRDHTFELDPEVCNNNNNNNDILDETLLSAEKKEHFRESMEDKALPADMFPMETLPGLPENVTAGRVPQPADEVMKNEECKRKINAEKRDNVDEEVRAITFHFTLLKSVQHFNKRFFVLRFFVLFCFNITKKNELFVPLRR